MKKDQTIETVRFMLDDVRRLGTIFDNSEELLAVVFERDPELFRKARETVHRIDGLADSLQKRIDAGPLRTSRRRSPRQPPGVEVIEEEGP